MESNHTTRLQNLALEATKIAKEINDKRATVAITALLTLISAGGGLYLMLTNDPANAEYARRLVGFMSTCFGGSLTPTLCSSALSLYKAMQRNAEITREVQAIFQANPGLGLEEFYIAALRESRQTLDVQEALQQQGAQPVYLMLTTQQQ